MIYNIVIADDHVIFRNGMVLMLNKIPNVRVVGQASNGAEAVEMVKGNAVDLVFMDIKMPLMDGIEATAFLTQNFPSTKIVALTMFGDKGFIQQMVDAGASGFMLKNADFNEIERAIQLVCQGGEYFSSEVAKILTEIHSEEQQKSSTSIDSGCFSKRELEVLKLMCEGLSSIEVSQKLHISYRTVEGHRSSMLQKTNLKNTISLILFAVKNNIILLS